MSIIMMLIAPVHVDTPDAPLANEVKGVAYVIIGLFVLWLVSLLFKRKK